MPAKTDFNVAPYWDDFNITDDFYRVLFRPGFAVQARELTTLQTILQNQIEQFGNHFFKEGTIVIPGSVAYDDSYYAVKIQATFGADTVSTYLSQYVGAVITGTTSGVTAEVVSYAVADSDTGDPDTLFVKYISTNTSDNETTTFTNDETISANKIINSLAAGVASSQLQATLATSTGSAASITGGIFFVRGFMCQTDAQSITLDKYTNTPSYRIGFTVTETLVTPEDDASLLDNAAGSSNFAAKGAHRLKITLTLAKLALTSTADSNFVELARVEDGKVVHRKKATEYSIVADMIARRTDDESGDYVVRHFDIEAREHLNDGTNRGIYSSAEGGLEAKDVLAIAPGKAYVNGYEVETQNTTYLPIDKARTTKNITGDTVPANLGQIAKVDNVYNQPDVTKVGATLDPFDFCKLYDQQTSSRGSSSGTNIGYARSRAFEYASGTVAAVTGIYNHYLFDITMFQLLTMNGSVTTLTADAVVTGATSGATGIVTAAVSSSASVYVMQVEGVFQTGEELSSSVSTDNTASKLISTITEYNFGRDVKQIFQDSAVDYTADIVLDQRFELSGEVTYSGSGTTLTGTSTKFLTELQVGDIIELPTGTAGVAQERRVTAIASNVSLTISSAGTAAATSVKGTRLRAKIAEDVETVLVYKTPRDNTKTLLDSSNNPTADYTFRAQYTATTGASSDASFSTGSASVLFASATAGADYTLSVRVAGSGGSAGVGDVIDISSTKAGSTTVTGEGTQTLTVTDATLMGTSAQVTLMATVSLTNKAAATKTATKMATKSIVSNASTGAKKDVFGERVMDKDISLSYADVYKLHAVYESSAVATVAAAPTLTITNDTGTFTVGEVITGSATGATGRVISDSSNVITYVALAGLFTTNDNITGGTSGFFGNVSSLTTGDRVVTSHFLLDTGQRDSYYDLGRISRKAESVTPVGGLLVVYDYFVHQTANDFFDVDSYSGQVDYADIPQYRASKVDPESKAPTGLYELRDSLDFRPAVQAQTSPTSCPFSFSAKNFEDSGAAAGNLPKPDSNITIDYDFYLGRLDLLYLDSLGNFLTVGGIPSETPRYPSGGNENMLVARYSVAPYTFEPQKDIQIDYDYNRRYTMRDIGKLESRIGKLEYATSLGLLERETNSFQVLDENGLDRFKAGFIVDNFYGMNIGNTLALDYNCAVDPAAGHLRPLSKQRMVGLVEENTTDVQRTTDQYQKTGDIITLPYTHTEMMTQPYASRAESVNPFSVTLWAGNMLLTPDSDFWMDEERVPAITIDVEGNYEQMLREMGGNADVGTIWDSWNTIWTGNERTSRGAGTAREVTVNGDNRWRQSTVATTVSVDNRQQRTGMNTRLVERIDQVSMGDRVVSIDVVPWIRTRDVNFTATGMKPNTKLYSFFDRIDVNAEVKPVSGSAQNTTLSSGLTKTATTLTVVSTTGFPTSGTLGIGDDNVTDAFGQTVRVQEQCTYTGLTATTFTGITRNTGNQFDEPQEHASGVAVTNQTYGTQLITDNVGTIYGRFKIPNTETKRFRVGTRTFRLTDSSTNSLVPGVVETSAQRQYTASGFVQTKREEIMNVRNGVRSDVTVIEERTTTEIISQSEVEVGEIWYDPLAQSVMCNEEDGVFITKFDVFFHSKDDTLPVWCEVRTMINGYPSGIIMPFSKISLQPADVNLDATAGAVATTFTFESPIYIQHNQEFCLVLASNSPNYKVWIARIGDVEIGGLRTISTQPTLGSLFKSQNASTWTPSQYEDLKFTLHRAEFDITKTGSFVVTNEEMTAETDLLVPARLGGGKDSGIPTLGTDPIETKINTAGVKVHFKNHNMHATNNIVKITGVKSEVSPTTLTQALTNSTTGTITVADTTNWPATGYVKIDSEVIYYDNLPSATSLRIPVGAPGRAYEGTAAAHENGSVIDLYMIGCDATFGTPLTEINKTHTSISGVELDSFIVNAGGTVAEATLTTGGTGVQCTRNVSMDVMYPLIQTMELPKTLIAAKAQTTTGTSMQNATQTSFGTTTIANAVDVPLNEDFFFDAPKLICSQVNEDTRLSGAKSFRLTNTLTSTGSTVSPVIDTSRMGVIAVANRTNYISSASDIGALSVYNASTAPSGDNNKGIYITKQVTLTQTATAIKVMFDAVVMADSAIKVLYKTLRTDVAEPFDDSGWTFFNTDGSPESSVPLSKNRGDFKEYQYFVGKNSLGIGDDLPEYVALAIKIVMQGTNSALPPLIKDFRTIAFQA